MSAVALCAGAGGLALGLEEAGFDPVLLVENRAVSCETLRQNRPEWNVLEADLLDFDPAEHPVAYDVDLLYGGLPRVPASAVAGRGNGDEEVRLLEAAVLLVHAVRPRALLIENVPELATKETYAGIRSYMGQELSHLGYEQQWFTLNARDFGVPQDRKEGVLVALAGDAMGRYVPPAPAGARAPTVGEALGESMAGGGWPQASAWAAQADSVAPTLVGGSWKRGGADLGPTGSKRAWARLGVDGGTVANEVPGPDFRWDPDQGRAGLVPLTVEQAATLQGFPEQWVFAGRKTARYRQVGNATPPPVGRALGRSIRSALD
ncbi:DNA cytosine methyltransferase [Streptomyces polyrhachis]|uniref:DNA (cytosine-5-)-methyltransferase n=1 Tax=Streptomyces polyrhachis TaxID=1282885 RepID=A0ABW2GDJ2_9ACTN